MKRKIVFLGFGIVGIVTTGYTQVGIGTNTPTVELDIESSEATTSIDLNNTAVDGDTQINFQLSGTTTFSMGVDDTDDYFKIGTTAPEVSNRLTIDNNGYVGLGTETPSVELDIESSAATTNLDLNNTAEDGDPQVNFQLSGTTTFSIGVDDTDDYFKIGTTAPAASNRLTIDDSGNIGVGTETPDYTLDIAGSAGIDEYIYHNEDTDTYFRLLSDQMQVYVGAEQMINIIEDGTNNTIVFNEDGGNNDFKVEGDTDPDLLVVDASTDMVGLATSSPVSTLDVNGSVSMRTTSISSNTTLDDSHYVVLCDPSLAGFTITLPTAASSAGRVYIIKEIVGSTNTISVTGDGAEKIDGSGTKDMSVAYQSMTIICDGSAWYVISE